MSLSDIVVSLADLSGSLSQARLAYVRAVAMPFVVDGCTRRLIPQEEPFEDEEKRIDGRQSRATISAIESPQPARIRSRKPHMSSSDVSDAIRH
jgi:hypothetical protein